MNERIQDLIDQATICEDHYPAGCNGHPELRQYFDKEKFAELIVQECIWEVVKDDKIPHDIQVLIGQRFKQHFGVEE